MERSGCAKCRVSFVCQPKDYYSRTWQKAWPLLTSAISISSVKPGWWHGSHDLGRLCSSNHHVQHIIYALVPQPSLLIIKVTEARIKAFDGCSCTWSMVITSMKQLMLHVEVNDDILVGLSTWSLQNTIFAAEILLLVCCSGLWKLNDLDDLPMDQVDTEELLHWQYHRWTYFCTYDARSQQAQSSYYHRHLLLTFRWPWGDSSGSQCLPQDSTHSHPKGGWPTEWAKDRGAQAGGGGQSRPDPT